VRFIFDFVNCKRGLIFSERPYFSFEFEIQTNDYVKGELIVKGQQVLVGAFERGKVHLFILPQNRAL